MVFRHDRKKRGGGVAIYVRLGISCKFIAESGDNKIEFLFLENLQMTKDFLLDVYIGHIVRFLLIILMPSWR